MNTNDKFIHSVKVPRLYKVASTIAKQYSEGVGSIKHLVYGGKKKHPVSIWVIWRFFAKKINIFIDILFHIFSRISKLYLHW